MVQQLEFFPTLLTCPVEFLKQGGKGDRQVVSTELVCAVDIDHRGHSVPLEEPDCHIPAFKLSFHKENKNKTASQINPS